MSAIIHSSACVVERYCIILTHVFMHFIFSLDHTWQLLIISDSTFQLLFICSGSIITVLCIWYGLLLCFPSDLVLNMSCSCRPAVRVLVKSVHKGEWSINTQIQLKSWITVTVTLHAALALISSPDNSFSSQKVLVSLFLKSTCVMYVMVNQECFVLKIVWGRYFMVKMSPKCYYLFSKK